MTTSFCIISIFFILLSLVLLIRVIKLTTDKRFLLRMWAHTQKTRADQEREIIKLVAKIERLEARVAPHQEHAHLS